MRDNFSMANNLTDEAAPIYFFKEWRKRRGFTQEALAEKVELTASSISQLESGKQGFSDTTLAALAKALECRPGDLLLWGPDDLEASAEKVRGADKIRKLLARIDYLTTDDIELALGVIVRAVKANPASQAQTQSDDRSQPATSRRVSTPSR